MKKKIAAVVGILAILMVTFLLVNAYSEDDIVLLNQKNQEVNVNSEITSTDKNTLLLFVATETWSPCLKELGGLVKKIVKHEDDYNLILLSGQTPIFNQHVFASYSIGYDLISDVDQTMRAKIFKNDSTPTTDGYIIIDNNFNIIEYDFDEDFETKLIEKL